MADEIIEEEQNGEAEKPPEDTDEESSESEFTEDGDASPPEEEDLFAEEETEDEEVIPEEEITVEDEGDAPEEEAAAEDEEEFADEEFAAESEEEFPEEEVAVEDEEEFADEEFAAESEEEFIAEDTDGDIMEETEDSEDLFAEEVSGDEYAEESEESDEYVEETQQGWFSRLGGAVKGVVIGALIFLIGFPLLFLNEGRAVKRYKTLKEGAGSVISVSADTIDPKNEGKLLHISGPAKTDEILTDGEKSSTDPPLPISADKAEPQNEGKAVYLSGPLSVSSKISEKDFGFDLSAIRLERKVRMYQWQEKRGSSQKDKKLGGKEVTKTSYTYKKTWSEDLISSAGFKQKPGHENPGGMKYKSRILDNPDVKLGVFRLHPEFTAEMNEFKSLRFKKLPGDLPADMKGKVQLYKGRLFMGKNPEQPEIGDMIIEYAYIKPQDISLIARQEKDMLVPHKTPEGKNLSRLLTGKRTLEEMLPPAGISVNAIKLKRTVQLYQWKEEKKTEKKGDKTLTKYSYPQVWSESLIDSDSFAKSGRTNPKSMPIEGKVITAEKVTVGAFDLPARFVQQMNKYETLPAESVMGALPESIRAQAKTLGDAVYIGKDPAAPQIGDLKITYSVQKAHPVSLIAQQQGKSFVPYQSKYEGSIDEFRMGTVSADAIFKQEKKQNTMMTWLLRLAGFLLMFIGLTMVFRPLSVVMDVIPFLGNLAEKGFALVAFLIAAGFTLFTIAIAWFFYRPLLSLTLIAVSVGAFFGMKMLKGKKGNMPSAGPPKAPPPAPGPHSAPPAAPPPPPGS